MKRVEVAPQRFAPYLMDERKNSLSGGLVCRLRLSDLHRRCQSMGP